VMMMVIERQSLLPGLSKSCPKAEHDVAISPYQRRSCHFLFLDANLPCTAVKGLAGKIDI